MFSLGFMEPILACCCCSFAKSCLTLRNPVNCSRPGFPVLHCLPEFAEIHVHWVGDAIQSSHLLLPPSSLALNLSQHQGLFLMSRLLASGSQSIAASASASVLPMNIQDWFPLGLTGLISMLRKECSRVFSSTTIRKHQFFGTQPSYGPILTSVHDYWKNYTFDYMDHCWQSDVSAF